MALRERDWERYNEAHEESVEGTYVKGIAMLLAVRDLTGQNSGEKRKQLRKKACRQLTVDIE